MTALLYVPLGLLVLANIWYLLRQRRTPAQANLLPSVSIIIPARNEAANLRRCIPTLLTQRYPNFEVIVFDDASEDDTAQVARSFDDPRVSVLSGDGPPAGWVGKVHALYQATRRANNEVFLFLDADTAFRHNDALHHLVQRFVSLPRPRVLSGIARLRGGGDLLVSLVPFWLLTFFPVPLAHRGRARAFGVMSGQCWMIERELYLLHEPHRSHPDEILEDVVIGRFLKSKGAAPHLLDLQQEVDVWMYQNHREAWAGFRKNAYLVAGGPTGFVISWTLTALLLLVLPALSLAALASVYALKAASDRYCGFPIRTTLLAPVSFVMGAVLQLDSAYSHLVGRVSWKGRVVGASPPSPSLPNPRVRGEK